MKIGLILDIVVIRHRRHSVEILIRDSPKSSAQEWITCLHGRPR
jgi:hypothetical protein